MKYEENIPDNFSPKIKKGIRILSELNGDLTDRQAAEALSNEGIGYLDAIQIAILLPVAFCRLLLPNIAWKDQYYEFNTPSEKGVERMFSNTEKYLAIIQEAKLFFATKPSSEIILKIAGRSSEFKAINEMLLAGKKLEEIELTPMCILW